MPISSTVRRFCVALVAALFLTVGAHPAFGAQPPANASAGVISGQIIDANGGLPIADATVELQRDTQTVMKSTTSADGTFRFQGEPPGTYSVLVTAAGYQTTRISDIVVDVAKTAEVRTAIVRSTGALKEIAVVSVGGHGSLQTSATINQNIEPQVLLNQNFIRAADAVGTLPGITASTSNAVGDDIFLSIRGFNPSETATLLDGHQIGPIGSAVNAFNTYDSQVSPFFGLSGIQVTYGSGATGLYGVDSIAGTVNYQTLEPTKVPGGLFEQGVGNDGKLLTGIQATGSIGKFGYAVAHAVEGTYGNFSPQVIWQQGLSGNDLTSATAAANTYAVSGDYLLRDDLFKLSYAFDPTAKLTFTLFSTNAWEDKTGNGDQDFLTYPFQFYNAQQALAQSSTTTVTLPNGSTATCTGSIAVLVDAAPNYQCLSSQQYAQMTSGPAGGGAGPFQGIRNHDYDLRFTKTIGSNNTLTVDGNVDDYATDFNRAVATGFFRSHFFLTHGLLVTDDFSESKDDLGFGFSLEHQLITNDQFPDSFTVPNQVLQQIAFKQPFDLNESGFFVNEQHFFNNRLSLFASLWVKHANVTPITSFDPRLSVVYRPSNSDVLRFTTGHSASVPQPNLAFAAPSLNGNTGSFLPNCRGNLQSGVGDVSDPNLGPEKATDYEVAYGHRFSADNFVQVNLYQANEQGTLFDGTLPFTALGNAVPNQTIQLYLDKIAQLCPNIPNPTIANLNASTTYNAAQARYQGIEISGRLHISRHVLTDYMYDVQSAYYMGVPDSILQQNTGVINGAQLGGIPLHKASLALEYQSGRGVVARIDGNYMGDNNSFNRPAFSWVNTTLSDTVGSVTLTFGVNNLFNNAAGSPYGLIGLGVFQPENQYGTDTSALSEGSELYGLPARQAMLTLQYRL